MESLRIGLGMKIIPEDYCKVVSADEQRHIILCRGASFQVAVNGEQIIDST